MNYEPLRITFDMLSPVALPLKKQPYPMHLDSLVIGLMTASRKEIFDTINKDKYAPGQNPDVPLRVCGERSPVYCASVAMASDIHRGNYEICKKPPTDEEIRMFRPKENAVYKPAGEGSGIHRAWQEEVQTVLPTQLVFECQGDKAALWDILTQVRRIGVFRRVGLGEVINIHIDPIDDQMAGLLFGDQPARMLPVIDWPEGERNQWNKVAAGVRAPYWHPANRELCWAPPVDTTIPNISVVDL